MKFHNAVLASVSILSTSLISTAAALRGTHNKRKALEEHMPYDVEHRSIDACPNGSVSAIVKDYQGNPIVGEDVGFLLYQQTVGKSYSGSVATDANGVATFDFEAITLDGSSLWCSIAIDNPNDMAPVQNVPCSVNVCEVPVPPQITGFTMVNAETDRAVFPGHIIDGDVIRLAHVGDSLSVIADTSGSVGQVQFHFDGREEFRTERVAPFALGGDIDSDFGPVAALSRVGKHTVSATAVSESGEVGPTATVTFYIEP